MRLSRAAIGSVTRGATIVALLALALAAASLQAQEVYKSVDANGHVVYSDRGTTKSAPKTSVHVDQPDPAEVARFAHEQELLKADDLDGATTLSNKAHQLLGELTKPQ